MTDFVRPALYHQYLLMLTSKIEQKLLSLSYFTIVNFFESISKKMCHFSEPYDEVNSEGYRIKIIGRGELLFYQQDNSALLVEIVFAKGAAHIFTASLKKWDNGKKITEEEKKLILKRVEKYFVILRKKKTIFVDKNGSAFTLS